MHTGFLFLFPFQLGILSPKPWIQLRWIQETHQLHCNTFLLWTNLVLKASSKVLWTYSYTLAEYKWRVWAKDFRIGSYSSRLVLWNLNCLVITEFGTPGNVASRTCPQFSDTIPLSFNSAMTDVSDSTFLPRRRPCCWLHLRSLWQDSKADCMWSFFLLSEIGLDMRAQRWSLDEPGFISEGLGLVLSSPCCVGLWSARGNQGVGGFLGALGS